MVFSQSEYFNEWLTPGRFGVDVGSPNQVAKSSNQLRIRYRFRRHGGQFWPSIAAESGDLAHF